MLMNKRISVPGSTPKIDTPLADSTGRQSTFAKESLKARRTSLFATIGGEQCMQHDADLVATGSRHDSQVLPTESCKAESPCARQPQVFNVGYAADPTTNLGRHSMW